jgi:DNA invertase Pin-like site-specific DNA recombinase
MGRARDPSTTPDLFSTRASTREPSSPFVKPPSSPTTTDAATAPSPRLVLPRDLPGAIKRLEDQDLDRLLSAALAEQQRRGRKPSGSNEISRKRRVEAVAVPLTQGKLNAVRAAFKAGVSPSKIARQFGLSQSDVRKALANDRSSRVPHRD